MTKLLYLLGLLILFTYPNSRGVTPMCRPFCEDDRQSVKNLLGLFTKRKLDRGTWSEPL